MFLPISGNAQHLLSGNLVINPGFEDYIQCPLNYGQIFFVSNWSDGQGGGGSSDYFNTCTTNAGLISILNDQYPKSGNAMVGIACYGNWIGHNYREYITGVLNDSLKKSKQYCGLFYTALRSSCKGAVENLGMYFSELPIIYSGNLIPLSYLQPQIENKKGIIKDTINWVKISGSFIANGGEKDLIIGNFRDNQHTNYLEVFYGAVAPYYYIDDVSVCECSFDINLGPDTTLCEGESIILNPNLPNATYTWQDSSHAATYEVKQSGTY